MIKKSVLSKFVGITLLGIFGLLSACGGGGGSSGGIPGSATLALFAGNMGGAGFVDGTGTAARFNYPNSVATDSAGNVYVADSNNNIIRKNTPGKVVTTLAGMAGVAGGDDGTGAMASFDLPTGVATDSAGNVYVADQNNSTIRKITPAGVVTTLAGTVGVTGSADGTGVAATFYFPSSVVADNLGNVYVADSSNHTIRKITPAGVVSTLAGTAGVPGSADSTGAAASFDYPSSVATDSARNVYVADSNNKHYPHDYTNGGGDYAGRNSWDKWQRRWNRSGGKF